MTNEIVGQKCGACGKAVHAGQSAVVCSACGAAHHGDCWLVAGKCGTAGCAGVTAPPPPMMAREDGSLLPPLPAGRPTGATVVAIILLVFGAWSLISLAVGFMQMASAGQTAATMAEQGFTMPLVDQAPPLILAALGVAGFLATGIGMLVRAAWSRMAAVAVLLADWALATGLTVATQVWMMPFIDQMHARGISPLDGRMAIGIASVMSVISLGVVLVLVYVLTRPNVVEAYT